MRLPAIVRPKSGVPWLVFRPSRRVEIYHRGPERAGGSPVLVAEVLTDGVQGRLSVFDPRFAPALGPLFEATQWVIRHGGRLAGVCVDTAPSPLRPWRKETIEHIVAEALVRFDLRGVIAELER